MSAAIAVESDIGSVVVARTVVIIDAHRTFAELFAAALEPMDDLDCVGIAFTLDSGLELVRSLEPELVVLDCGFGAPDLSGVALIRSITDLLPLTRVLVLTSMPTARLLSRAAAAGATSMVDKDSSFPDLLSALRSCHLGGVTVDPRLLSVLMSEKSTPHARTVRKEWSPDPAPLSVRELEVVELLTEGLSAVEIGRILGITLSTCRGYIKTLLHKLDAHSQLEAVAIARHRGLLRTAHPSSQH